MTSNVDRMIDGLLGREGGYVNHPHDRGGETIWGITAATARANGYLASMRHMTREQAREIYRAQYWHRPGFARVEPIFPRVADELFDTGVNMGPAVAGEMLQRALNALGGYGLKVDGAPGPKTLEALADYKARRGRQSGEEVLVRVLDSLQGERYVALVERRMQNRSFVFGWFAHRIRNA